jgi:glutamyl/glutaminyl-tRNA synthetase
MILGEDHTKLSKRHGSVSLRDYRIEGYLPEALVNYMALLGFSPKTKEKEFFTLNELIEEFSIENLSKSNAIFSPSKLRWMNHKYIEMLSIDELFIKVKDFIKDRKLNIKSDEWLKEFLRLLRDHIFILSDIERLLNEIYSPINLNEQQINYLKENKKLVLEFYDELKRIENWNEIEILNRIREIGKRLSIKGKNLYMPLRILLTHREEGPEIYIYTYLLGRDESLKRIEEVIKIL